MIVVIWVVVGWACALALLGLWGILTAIISKTQITVSYITLLIVFIVTEIAVGVFVVIFRSNVG